MTLDATRRSVIVAVDGSAASNAAVSWAVTDSALRNLAVMLVYVRPRWRGGERVAHAILSDAAALVEGVRGDNILELEMHSQRGHPVSVLVELSGQAERIVMGFRGSGALGAGLLGPVTEGVVHRAYCPVAVVHRGRREDPDSARMPILVGVDGSASSDQAVALAFEEAHARAVPLVAVYVADAEAAVGPAGSSILQAALEPWQRIHPGVDVRSSIVCGDPSSELLSMAASAQLVVVGSRGRGGFVRTMLGSVSSAVVQSVEGPVLVARPFE